MTSICSLCKSSRREVFSATLLKKHQVDYFYCERCGLLQTEEPFWLEEAYADAIADADTGLVARNQSIARRLSALLYFCFDKHGKYLDTAGGYGLLTRLMRDIGFDFYWHDEYCQNLFARGFESDKLQGPVSAVTAFEVLEHIPDPLPFIGNLLRENDSSTLILTTELFAGNPPPPGEWWYYTPDTGQHVSFYQTRTLRFLANQLSLNLYSHRNVHVLTDRKLNNGIFKLLTGKGSWLGYGWIRTRMPSRTFPDHEHQCSRDTAADRL